MSETVLQRAVAMALSVKSTPYCNWPAWSTGQALLVALILDDLVAIHGEGFTMLEAISHVGVSVADLLKAQQKVR